MSSAATSRTCLAIVLAAGEGTRMRSAKPKVLHAVAGRSMLGHVLAAVSAAGATHVAVVVGPDREDVAMEARAALPSSEVFVQRERLGTAHAVLAARAALQRGFDDVVIAFADTPLITAATFGRMRDGLAQGATVVGLAFEPADPTGYGRMIIEQGALTAIVEHKDATPEQHRIRLCNAGLMALSGDAVISLLEAIGNSNAQKEFYLTDAPAVATARGLKAVVLTAPEDEVQGVNDRVQLAVAEAIMQRRLREAAMRNGVTMIAPETVFLTYDTKIDRDVLVEPYVFFGPGVIVDTGAVIHSHSHLEGAHVGPKATIGPFARLRPGARLSEKAKVGNFVEIKGATLGAGAKVNHLTYIGDADIGANANIGAGTITCNYDGYSKFRTVVGEGAFIGSNSSLVAPVTIAAGAYVGSGSVVTKNVPADALAVARGRQSNIEGWAASFRAAKEAQKKPGSEKA
jgi:bifunctional UDP-N-acetylglucosamine pyrophosphorylase/glucosamine-1-phosphate N-acetyltransferase